MQQISPNVYVETKWKGANPGIICTAEGLVMVDTPHRPSDSLKWREEVKSKGEVRYLINTEHHIDHFTGNSFFGGTVISHKIARDLILETPTERIVQRVEKIDPKELPLVENYKVKAPSVTFTDRMSLYLGNHTLDLVFLPGHTPGQIAVHIPEEKVLFTGDNIFHKVQIFLHESDPFQWLDALKKIQEMDDVDVIVPGHGEVCDQNYVTELSSFIQEWMDTVEKAIEKGMSKEEAMDKISFLGRYPMDVELDAMGPTVQRWNVERLYDLLKK